MGVVLVLRFIKWVHDCLKTQKEHEHVGFVSFGSRFRARGNGGLGAEPPIEKEKYSKIRYIHNITKIRLVNIQEKININVLFQCILLIS